MEIELYPIPNQPQGSCFACGAANPYGLQLKFFSDGTSVYCNYNVPEKFAGWNNLVHGGIISTMLDETMAWTVIHLQKKYILTKSFQIDFLKPVIVKEDIQLTGRILEYRSEREVLVEALLKNSQGNVCAKTIGTIAVFAPTAFRRLNIFDKVFLDSFEKDVWGNS